MLKLLLMKLIPIAIGPFFSAALFTKLRRKGLSPSKLILVFFGAYYMISIAYYLLVPPIVNVVPEIHFTLIAGLTTLLMAVMCFAFWFDEFIS